MAGKLTKVAVERARHPGGSARPVRLADGDGLFLQVTKDGAKSWVYRFNHAGKAREMGLGSLRDVGLPAARVRRDEARSRLRAGADPIEHKAAQLRSETEARSRRRATGFRVVAEEFIAARQAAWANKKHRAQWPATLARYVYPVIGELPVGEIAVDDIRRVLDPIWREKPETARRVRGRIESVLDYAKALKLRSGENPAAWRNNLQAILPSPRTIVGKEPENHPALHWKQVGAFVGALRSQETMSALALEFLIHTASRTGEVIGVKWGEIDLDEAIWTVPRGRMKSRREHRVPLSEPALQVLRRVHPLSRGPDSFVFTGRAAASRCSNMALLMLLRRMNEGGDQATPRWLDRRTGEPIVPHGFRSSFRDWAGEYSSYPTDLAEAALAHVVRDKTEAAYARGDLFDKRRDMMAEWSAFCLSEVA